ncbi:hypothetical protein AQ925_06630 [Burkholderia pseudomallei]|nr:hypothetical protein AQ925_06630 [Burkholderia pseudomallei]OND02628.1 hypothetical protein AQ926_00165 [Burkholderia pseudomallei]OND02760.1 hypothetical protein AQ927_03420 [Burkholderia pseudomallei]OND12401.1 hypothetical protein AQ928_29480 [Burkholderia pseudomallei]OND18623.1 hypothetical protein AQ929_26215 [Burkholderia pseudomallei]
MASEMQRGHDLSGSLASFHVEPVFIRTATGDTAPQPAQADAPDHAAECPHCDGEGVIEGDSGMSSCACQRDAQEGIPTFGARREQDDAQEGLTAGQTLYERLHALMPDWYPDAWEDLLPKYQIAYTEAADASSAAQADAPAVIDVGVDCLTRMRKLMTRFGIAADESIEGFSASIEDHLNRLVRVANAFLDKADAPAEAREPITREAMLAAIDEFELVCDNNLARDLSPEEKFAVSEFVIGFFENTADRAPADAGEASLTDAARDMLAERRRQVEAEGWTPGHDDQYQHGVIALAAACYAANAGGVAWADPLPSFWPWMHNWWKPTTPRRDLVKAGALILAELERLDRAALLNGADHDR